MKQLEIEPTSPTPALDRLQALIARERPVLDALVRHNANQPLGDYVSERLLPRNAETIDPGIDFVNAVSTYAGEIYGPEIAAQVEAQLTANPVINTGPHAGVNTFPLTFQGSLLVGLGESSMVIVTPCGGVPMNNVSKPMRALVGKTGVNIYSNSSAHVLTDAAPAYTPLMVETAKQNTTTQSERSRGKIILTVAEKTALDQVLSQAYSADGVFKQTRYVDQAAIVDRQLWHMLFKDQSSFPDLVSLEQEKITASALALHKYFRLCNS